jgi:hypothetical protein
VGNAFILLLNVKGITALQPHLSSLFS